MAEGSVVSTGLEALRQAAADAPARVDAVCARVALATANAMAVDARRRVLDPHPPTKGPHQHTPGESLAEAIEVVEDLEHHEYRVVSNAPSQYPANLTIWTEHGTSHQPARPYMQPSAAAAQAPYERDLRAALDELARELLG